MHLTASKLSGRQKLRFNSFGRRYEGSRLFSFKWVINPVKFTFYLSRPPPRAAISRMATVEPSTVQQLSDAVTLMGTTGSGPMPKDPAVAQAWVMSNVHALMLSCLKHIYLVIIYFEPFHLTQGLEWYSMRLLTSHVMSDSTVDKTQRPKRLCGVLPCLGICASYLLEHRLLRSLSKYLCLSILRCSMSITNSRNPGTFL